MNQSSINETFNLIIAVVSFFALLVIVFFLYKYLFRFFKKRVFKTPGKLDDFILNLFRIPALGVIYWVMLTLFTRIFLSEFPFYPYLSHINELLLIFSFAWIQIAITQPIRIDDVVIVEGEWGRIEEITLTYVVVKIWDERRLILPITWFLEKPFQNWTRLSAAITGTILLYVDYDFPVESIRQALPGMLNGNSDWDGRTVNVQVTNTTERFKEVRVLLSSATV